MATNGTPVRLSLTQMGIWSKRVRVQLGEAYEEVVVQTIGNRAAALEYGHEAMQGKLLEFRAEGERFAALTGALRLSATENLAAFVVEGERPAMLERLAREMPEAVEPRRDLAAGESEENFAHRYEEWEGNCQKLRFQRQQELKRRIQQRQKELCALPKDQLIELARARRIDIECWNAFHQACDDWVLFEATRCAEEPSRLYFPAVQEVRKLHPEVKAQLAAAYRALDWGGRLEASPAEADASAPLRPRPEARPEGTSLPKACFATGAS